MYFVYVVVVCANCMYKFCVVVVCILLVVCTSYVLVVCSSCMNNRCDNQTTSNNQ